MPSTDASQSLFLYSTTVSDVGTVRSNNQDSSFAGERLAAICDGMGGHAGGDTASTIAVRSLAHIERDDTGDDVKAVSGMLETSVMAAHDAIVGKAKRERKLAGMGTTVTALALVGRWWVLAHIGDSRAYLLRDGKLTRMTQDHSYVQHLIDTGRISEAEARNHPQRNVVMRVLGDFDIDPHPDVAMFAAHPADRWMLCSDGLSGVLEDSTIEETLTNVSDQGECAQQLVAMALKAGSTDNVTVVVADAALALDADAFDLPHQTPLVGGAASANLEPIADIVHEPVSSAPVLRDDNDSPARRAAALTQEPREKEQPRMAQPATVREQTGDLQEPDTGEIPIVQKKDGRLSANPNDPEVASAIQDEHDQKKQESHKKSRRSRIVAIVILVIVLVAAAAGAGGTYLWSQTKYYLGDDDGVVTIYQGVPTDLFGIALSHPVEETGIRISELPQSWQTQLQQGIVVDSLEDARDHAELIEEQMRDLEESQSESSNTTNGTDDSDANSDTSSDNSSDNSNSSTDGSADDSSTSDSSGDGTSNSSDDSSASNNSAASSSSATINLTNTSANNVSGSATGASNNTASVVSAASNTTRNSASGSADNTLYNNTSDVGGVYTLRAQSAAQGGDAQC